MQNTKGVLGVDIGGVIIDRVRNDNSDTSFFSDNYLRTSAVRGAFQAIARIREHFDGQVYLVSKCGESVERKTRLWLVNMNFYGLTGLRETNVHFCRTRAGKAPICVRLGITHFVDDRLEVLSYLTMVKKKYLFQPNEKEVEKFKQHLEFVQQVHSWEEVLKDILPPKDQS